MIQPKILTNHKTDLLPRVDYFKDTLLEKQTFYAKNAQ